MDFAKFMNTEKSVNRWFILRIAIVGGMCGAILATVFLFGALGK
jgi:hypothetical protein